jgi:hypothetical protein
MKAKFVNIPSFEKMYNFLPKEIQDYIDKCANTPQSSDWHPEAPNEKVPHNVKAHIRIVYNRAKKTEDINQVISALFHDLGKADVTKLSRKGKWSAYGHEYISSKLVEKYKNWIGSMGADWFQVYNIVKEHMRIKRFDEMRLIKQEQLRQNPYFDKINQFTKFDNMSNLTKEEEMK